VIIENNEIKGIKSELNHLDDIAENLGFVRWQWEYTRATYDYKIEDPESDNVYYLRFNTRAVEGKLENPHAVLKIEDIYIGRATFPHGLDYQSPVPQKVLNTAEQKLSELKKQLS
jgi:hypothetical protein